MTLDAFLSQLDGAKPRGARWEATCPAHADKSPSLQISEGEKGILLKCWAGCGSEDICTALGITMQDLFFTGLDSDPQQRKAAAQERERRQQQQAAADKKRGQRIDALREAEYFIHSRRGLDISRWTNQKLDKELNVLADAYALLASEDQDA